MQNCLFILSYFFFKIFQQNRTIAEAKNCKKNDDKILTYFLKKKSPTQTSPFTSFLIVYALIERKGRKLTKFIQKKS